jgi:hypothetical protein
MRPSSASCGMHARGRCRQKERATGEKPVEYWVPNDAPA